MSINTINLANIANNISVEDIGDDHLFTGLETPLKPDAFVLSDEEKKEKIELRPISLEMKYKA